MNDAALRKNLVELLRDGQAHATVEKALKGLKPELRNVRPQEGIHSAYELIGHMWITQKDILRYTLDPDWVSPGWPDGHWPSDNDSLTEEIWEKTVSGFSSDLEETVALAMDERIDLTARIPHGEWRTYLRQVLLVADHNAYHTAQIAQTRKTLGNWPG